MSAATAALIASRAEAERLRALRKDAETVSQRAVEAAEAQVAAADARVRIARQKLAVAWCDAPLPSDSAALVLVDLPAGQSLAAVPASARVTLIGHEDQPLPATVLCAERKTEPETQGQGFWLLVRTPSPMLHPGVAVTAYLAVGEPRTGVVIPRAAVVRVDGKAWVYEPVSDTQFVRREVTPLEMKSQIQIGEGGK